MTAHDSRRTATLAVLIALAGVRAAMPGIHEWTPRGPAVEHVYDLAIDPQIPSIGYATTRDGLLKTVDGGQSWSRSEPDGIPGPYYDDFVLAIDPRNPSILYAGIDRRVLKSDDGGGSWIPAGWQNAYNAVSDLVIDPHDPSVLYATTVFEWGDCSPGGCDEYFGSVYKSVDGGQTWTDVADGIVPRDFRTLAIDPLHTSTLYAGTSDGVWKSDDAGGSWSEARAGLPAESPVLALVIDPRDPSILYAGTAVGVYRSIDGGGSWWVSSQAAELGTVNALAIDPDDPDVLYAGTRGTGIYKTTDGGLGWTAVRTEAGSRWVNALAIHPLESSILYAGTSGAGVVKSGSAGEGWSVPDTEPRTRAQVSALAIGRRFATTFYAGTVTGGVYKSADEGRSWEAVNRGLDVGEITLLAIAPSQASVVYAGTRAAGVWHTRNGGDSWAPSSYGLDDSEVRVLAIDPENEHRAYAATEEGLYVTTDGGERWRRSWTLPIRTVSALVVDPQDPWTLYAGSPDGLYKSANRGRSWVRSQDGLPDEGLFALAIHPQQTDVVYAGTRSGVYKSLDAGRSWFPSSTGLCDPGCPYVRELIVDPRTSVVVAGSYRGIFASADGGASWSPVEPRSPVYGNDTLALHPWSPSTFYVAGNHRGLLEMSRPRCDAAHLCFDRERFSIELVWSDGRGGSGTARAATAVSQDSGVLWFFDEDNWEMLVKVLDGCALNDRFWVFAAATTNVEYGLRVTDTATGSVKSYFNPRGQAAAALADTDAFATCDAAKAFAPADTVVGEVLDAAVREADSSPAAAFQEAATPRGCADSPTRLCLQQERFRVEVEWRDFQGNTGSGRVVPFRSEDSGLLWFFAEDNWEMLVKVLDGCALNQHFWVFAAATTNVEYRLRVTDTATGAVRSYTNPLGQAAAAIVDTRAFATCTSC